MGPSTCIATRLRYQWSTKNWRFEEWFNLASDGVIFQSVIKPYKIKNLKTVTFTYQIPLGLGWDYDVLFLRFS